MKHPAMKRTMISFVLGSLGLLYGIPAMAILAGESVNQAVSARLSWSLEYGEDVSADTGISGARAVQLRGELASRDDHPVVLKHVPMGRGVYGDFRLEPFDVFTPEARLMAMSDDGPLPLLPPEIRYYRGRPVDGGDGVMFLSVQADSFLAVIESAGEMIYIMPTQRRGEHVVVPAQALPRYPLDNFCGADLLPENRAFIERFRQGWDGPLGAMSADRLEADVMLDVNYSLYRYVFGSNTTTASAYATNLIGALSVIYERDINTQLRISTLTIWTTQDPFTDNETSSSAQLASYRTYVINNRGNVSRDVAHLLANANVTNYGGIAYLNALCSTSNGYGVSNIYGNLTFPVSGYAWDTFVTSHEVGHNFGSPHTHCYNPPIDMCYGQEAGCYSGPSVATLGTIMSYCHLTSGGISMVFHQRTIDLIRPIAEAAACLSVVSSTPSINVSAPNGGENWPINSTQTITWSSVSVTGNVKIELSRNGGSTYETLFADTANDGSQSWTVTGAATTQARIRITSLANPAINDVSNANFSISEPPPPIGITLIAPNGGENWPVGSVQVIRWTSNGVSGNVRIRLSRDGGATYTTLTSNTANDGSFEWTVTGPATTQARIEVQSRNDSTIRDVSDANFTISDAPPPPPPPSITVLVPNGGETWRVGTVQTIQWSSTNVTGTVSISLSTNGGRNYTPLFSGLANTGSIQWSVNSAASTKCRIRVASDDGSASDTSDANFKITQ
ncbi:MAG: zinc-dependent metalloprotease [Acidobacteriota bacterium]|nr:zinc-dependent metalloprotease [Blastocatellia bacterium]MDW8241036.1 zinc-dependent metalloprotease [Acidobacteriota bacterium]